MKNFHKIPDIGERFGLLVVISVYKTKNKYGEYTALELRCDCGNFIKNIRLGHLYGSTKKNPKTQCGTCGFKERGIKSRKFFDNSPAKNAVYLQYKSSAKRRGIDFKLDKKTFFNTINQCCIFCGDKDTSFLNPPNTSPWSQPYLYTGIDRINSLLGYVHNNIQPCCKWCNNSKNNRSDKEFIDWVKKIINNKKVDK